MKRCTYHSVVGMEWRPLSVVRGRFAPQPQEGFIIVRAAVMLGAELVEEQNEQVCGRVLDRRHGKTVGFFRTRRLVCDTRVFVPDRCRAAAFYAS